MKVPLAVSRCFLLSNIGLWMDIETLAGALQGCQRAQNRAVILNGPWGESQNLALSLCFVCANIVNGPLQVSVMI